MHPTIVWIVIVDAIEFEDLSGNRCYATSPPKLYGANDPSHVVRNNKDSSEWPGILKKKVATQQSSMKKEMNE